MPNSRDEAQMEMGTGTSSVITTGISTTGAVPVDYSQDATSFEDSLVINRRDRRITRNNALLGLRRQKSRLEEELRDTNAAIELLSNNSDNILETYDLLRRTL